MLTIAGWADRVAGIGRSQHRKLAVDHAGTHPRQEDHTAGCKAAAPRTAVLQEHRSLLAVVGKATVAEDMVNGLAEGSRLAEDSCLRRAADCTDRKVRTLCVLV